MVRRRLFAEVEDEFMRQLLKNKYYEKLMVKVLPWGAQLRGQVFSLGDLKKIESSLSYRRLNDWESKGLIDPGRIGGDKGWRKFSVPDAVMLLLITELRKFGVGSHKVKTVVDMLETRVKQLPDSCSVGEMFIWFSRLGHHSGILVHPEVEPGIYPTDELLQKLVTEPERPDMFLYIPYSDLVSRVYSAKGTLLDFDARDIGPLVSSEYLEVLRMITDRDYENVTVTKLDGKVVRLTGVVRRKGEVSEAELLEIVQSRNFGRINISRKSGKTIELAAEDTYKF